MGQEMLRGVLPVFQTPYSEDGTPDLDVLETELRWMLGHGVDGIVMGMVSEVLRLSPSEVTDIAIRACDVANEHHSPAVISIGAESTFVAVQNAQRAEGFGASALMAIPPIATATSDEEQFEYYSAILRSVAIPVVVQDASGYVGRPLSIGMQARLRELFPDQVMFKPEAQPIGPRVSALRDATYGGALIFEGTGGIAMVDSHRRGIVGTMPGADLCWAAVALWRALEVHDDAAVNAISGPLVSLISMQTNLDAFLAIEKHLLRLQGVFKNTLVRGPVSYRLDPESAVEVERLFGELERAVADVGQVIS